MDSASTGDPEILLADLELTRGLTIQMTALSTLGLIVAATVLGGLFQTVTGQLASFQFTPGVAWWTSALDVLVILVLGTVFLVPHEWLHGLAIRYYGGEAKYGVGIAHFILLDARGALCCPRGGSRTRVRSNESSDCLTRESPVLTDR